LTPHRLAFCIRFGVFPNLTAWQHSKCVQAALPAVLITLALCPANAWAQNPTPFLDSLSPTASAPTALQGLPLTLNGAGFVLGATVNFNGTSLTPTFVSSTQIRVTVPVASLAAAQTAAVTVVNADASPANGVSNTLFFGITAPTSNVAFSRNDISSISANSVNSVAVVVADFNGDGRLDFAVLNSCDNSGPSNCSAGNVLIFLSKADGTFSALPGPQVGVYPQWMVEGDFNGDGKPDLAVVNNNNCITNSCTSPGSVSILLGNGDGTFRNGSTVSVGYNPYSGAVGDFNSDGVLDLVVVNGNDNNISILLGKGDGTFNAGVTTPVGSFPDGVVTADFNGDGKLDLAVTNSLCASATTCTLPGTVSILLGNGDGTFVTSDSTPVVGVNPGYLVAGDLNGDGKPDLVVDNSTDQTISVLLGNGDGKFAIASTLKIGAPQYGPAAIGDLNGDGKLDLAVPVANCGTLPCAGTGSVSIFLGNGDGTFGTGSSQAVGYSPVALALGDFTGDGRLGLAVANDCGTDPTNCSNSSISILLQQPFATVSSPKLIFSSQAVNSISPTKSVTLTAGASMAITGIAMGAGSTNFMLITTPTSCPYAGGPLPAAASCTVDVQFAPTITGPLTGTVTLTDNSGGIANSTQTVSLSGTGLATQSITFNPIPSQVQGTPLSLSASASSGLPVSFASLTPSVCTLSGAAATLLNPGTCTIQASQAGNAAFAPAPIISQSFAVQPKPNFTINSIPPAETVYRGVLAAFILELKSTNGFNGNVALSCSGGPVGSNCSDFPKIVHVNGTAYALSGILFPKKTADGTYTITFSGVSGSLTNTATANFTVK
jgi:hypothetical protein